MAHSGTCRVSWRGGEGCAARRGASRGASGRRAGGGGGSGSCDQEDSYMVWLSTPLQALHVLEIFGIDGTMSDSSKIHD